jgi:hypothetical protein
MAYPGTVSITVQDGGLQLVAGGQNFPLVAGVSSAGSNATLYMGTDPQTFKTTVGRGPGVDIALDCIQAVGGCFFLKLEGGVAAANSAVTAAPIGTGTGTITVAGAATHDFQVKVRIKKTGTVAVGKFDYSLDRLNTTADSDRTFSEEITIPSGGTFVVPGTGLTLTFVPGAGAVFFEVGDTHTFTSTCAHYNTTNLGAGITALLASPLLTNRKIRKVCFSGIPATASAAATLAAAIATHMSTLATGKHFARAMMDGGSIDTSANYLANYVAAFANSRVAATYALEHRISPQPFAGFGVPRVSGVHSMFVRAVRAQISENLGRVASGPLDGVVAIANDEFKSTLFTEADKTNTFRTDQSGPGFFSTNGYLKSPAGSDFLYWDYGILLDEGTTVADQRLAQYRNSKVRTLKVPNQTARPIHPVSAAQIEMNINGALAEVMRGPTVDNHPSHVEEQAFTVDQTNDVFGTRIVRSTYRVVPLPPAENLELTVGLARSVTV